MEPTPPVTVLIVDDDPLVRETLVHYLAASPDVVLAGMCADGQESVAAVEQLQPDVVLMDLVMPVMDGHAAIRAIHRVAPRTRVLALTTLDDDRTAARVLDEGAAGYILKGTRQAAVIGAILAAHGGVTVLPGATRAALLAERHDGASVVLEPREREILLRIRNGLTNPEIARELFVSHSTIKADVARLLRKLGATKRAQAVARAHQLGVLE